MVEERFAAYFGENAHNAAGNTAAHAYATWLAVRRQKAVSAVTSTNGFMLTAADSTRIELRNFERSKGGKVADLTVCAGQPDAVPLCRRIGDAVELRTPQVVATSPTLSLTRWATFFVGPLQSSALFTVDSGKTIRSASAAEANRVDVRDAALAITAPTGVTSAQLVVTYADGTTETLSVVL